MTPMISYVIDPLLRRSFLPAAFLPSFVRPVESPTDPLRGTNNRACEGPVQGRQEVAVPRDLPQHRVLLKGDG